MMTTLPSRAGHFCSALVAAMALVGCSEAPPPRNLASARLLSISLAAAPEHGIVSLAADGADDAERWLYRAPAGSEIRQLAVARDESFLVYSFVPPPQGNARLFDRSALYRMDLTAPEGNAERLIGGDTAGEYLLEPALSPDGRYCYHVRVAASDDAINAYSDVTLRRLDLRTGEVQDIIANGIWPTVSPDGRKIAFVGVQPLSQQRGLFLANADGSKLEMLVRVGKFFDVDAPAFTPDGRHLVFAVAEQDTRIPAGQRRSLSSRLLSLIPINAAQAHNDHDVASDWWRVATAGGEPERLTQQEQIMSYGAFAGSDGPFAYATTNGIYLTNLSGDSPTVVRDEGVWMSMAWLGGR
ncbi:MAG: hypothetical protein AAGA68_04775 [Pseudomonadota bacterium]